MSFSSSEHQPLYELRSYQEDLVQQVWRAWSQGARRTLMALPTGAGKTVIFSCIAREFTVQRQPVLVVVHREELLQQAREKLEAVTGEPVGLIKSGYKENRSCLIQVASVQSLLRRQFPSAELLVIDECHHSVTQSWTKLLEHYSESYILGVSATPARTDGQGFKYLYDELIAGPSVRWLIENHYLCDFLLFAAPSTVKIKRPKKNESGRDYTQKELEQAVNTSLVMGDLIKAKEEFAPGKKTAVFAVSVEHSQAIARAYSEAGIRAEHLDGDTPANERKAILERFKSGETMVLCNCGIIAEGFDVPSLEAVQIVRPTQSLILWLQMVGRSLRSHPGKEKAIIIDHTENWSVFGAPDQPWAWSLEPVSLKSKRWNVVCPECSHVFKPLPHEQKPYKYEWSAAHGEFRLWCLCHCPNCLKAIEMEKWLGGGEPPPPRKVNNDPTAEIREIPADCDWQILGTLYQIVSNLRRSKKELPFFQELADLLVEQYAERVGIPELREVALFYIKDREVAVERATFYYLEVARRREELARQAARKQRLNEAIAAIAAAQTFPEVFGQVSRYSGDFSFEKILAALPPSEQKRVFKLCRQEQFRQIASRIALAATWEEVLAILFKNQVAFDAVQPFLSAEQRAVLEQKQRIWQLLQAVAPLEKAKTWEEVEALLEAIASESVLSVEELLQLLPEKLKQRVKALFAIENLVEAPGQTHLMARNHSR